MKKLLLTLAAGFCLLSSSTASGPRVLFIGDSITDGNWGGGNALPSGERNHWDQNHIFGSGYMYICAAHYMGHYPEKGYHFINRGISGHTLHDLGNRWQSDVIEERPDVLSILVGTNDVAYSLDNGTSDSFNFGEWESSYRALLDTALTLNPSLKIVLCSPFVGQAGDVGSKPDYPKREEMVSHCATIAEKIASDYNAGYVPFDKLFAQLPIDSVGTGKSYWLWDGIHPTPAAHQLMAELWMKIMGEEL